MANLNRDLLEALFSAIHAAPAAERQELERALEAYTTTYHRSVRGAPILLQRLLVTIREAAATEDESGKIRLYDAFRHTRRVSIPASEEHD